MRYIALEEAFSIPELTGRQPPPWPANRFSQRHLADWARKLPDFTEYRLPEMDAAGIDVQVLSLTVPGLQADVDAAAARDDARFANDYLDEPRYDEVWAALEELSVPLYLHPGAPPADHWKVLDGRPELYGATWSWAAETGGHALRVLYGGVFDRHPRATLILGHMGEFLPFMCSRLDSRYLTLDPETPLQRMPSAYIGSNIVITTSRVFSPAALTGAVLEIGADAVLFSVDYPYESSHQAVAGLERTTLSDTDRDKIAHGNAERLLRL